MEGKIKVPYQRVVTIDWAGNVAEGVGAGAVNLLVPDSQYYTQFVVQVTGFKAGTPVTVQGSVDGVTFAPLYAANYFIPGPFTADANGVVFSIDARSTIRGGLRFAVGDNADAGRITVSMWVSPINTTRGF
jgi:hypothetical protein